MQSYKNIFSLLFLVACSFYAKAQDPHFTQFYSAPLTVNPAYAGHFDGSLRVISNYRQQWISSIDPLNTTSVQIDGKLNTLDPEENKPYSLGLLAMNDNSMNGTFNSNYIMAAGSYRKEMDAEGIKKLALGFSTTYGSRSIDYSNLGFSEQFRSGVGYNLSLPTGEYALSNLKPFVSMATGLLYSYQDREKGTYFDAGASVFHINRPKQTVFKDDNQIIAARYTAQASWQQYFGDETMLNVKFLYQNQASTQYYHGGVSVSRMLGSDKYNFIGAGIWYRSNDAVSPYLFMEFSKTQLGLTYDINTSDLKNAPTPTKSFELSLQWRLDKEIR